MDLKKSRALTFPLSLLHILSLTFRYILLFHTAHPAQSSRYTAAHHSSILRFIAIHNASLHSASLWLMVMYCDALHYDDDGLVLVPSAPGAIGANNDDGIAPHQVPSAPGAIGANNDELEGGKKHN